MPEPTNDTLTAWLRDVVLTDIDTDAIKGYQAVLARAAKCSPEELLDVVALGHQAADADKVAWFANLAHDKQPAVPLAGSQALVVRLAAASVVRAVAGSGASSVVVGLAAQSARFLGLIPDVAEVPEFVDSAIALAGDAARVRPPKPDSVAAQVPKWIRAGFSDAPDAAHDEWAVALREIATALDGFAADVHRQLALLDEEYDVLWWSHAGRSTTTDEPWSKVEPIARRSLLVALELGSKVGTPATPMIDGLVAVALGDSATKSIPIADVVVAARDEGIKVADVEHRLLPISTAIAQARIYDDDTWITVLDKMHGIKVKTRAPAAAIARQLIREQQLGRLL